MLNEITNLQLSKFSKDYSRLHRSLIRSLDEDDSWKILLDTLRSSYNILCSDEPFDKRKSSSPSLVLLTELENRFATVYHLRCFLRESELFEPLALISEPEPLKIVKQPGREDKLFTVNDMGKLTMECRGEGLPPPRYQWYFGNLEIPQQTNPTLIISNFGEENCGEYYCVLSHVIDDRTISVESNHVLAELTPIPPTFLENGDLPPEKLIYAGSPFTISVFVDARPTPTYTWLKNNIVLEGLNSNTLEFECIQPEDQDVYKCLIRNLAGEISTTACTISVYMGPEQSLPNNAASHKMALLIGNSEYLPSVGKLTTPADDVVLISQKLREINFSVIQLLNLTSVEMRGAIRWFYRHIPANAYAVFYYAGHGFMTSRYRYMMPVDVQESYELEDCYSDQELIKKVMRTKVKLFAMVLDMCSNIPDRFKKQDPGDEEKIVKFVTNSDVTLFRLYSASDYMKAYESSECRNGLFTKYFGKIVTLDYPIAHMYTLVEEEFRNSRTKLQVPSCTISGDGRRKLTDQVPYYGEKTEIDEEMEKWNNLPEEEELKFERVNVYTCVKLSFHKDCFKNALDLFFPNELKQWIITAELSHENLTNYTWGSSESGEPILTIYDLQKATSSISITIKLNRICSRNYKKLEMVDFCVIDLDYLEIVNKKLGL